MQRALGGSHSLEKIGSGIHKNALSPGMAFKILPQYAFFL